jgi:hypothetical protein
LWMSKAQDVFTMVVIFWGKDWMPKTCQYVTPKGKISKGLKYISIKFA